MKKERVINAIKHKETDIVPYNIELTQEELLKVSDYLKIDSNSFFDYAGNHLEKLDYNTLKNHKIPGYFKDDLGVIWDRTGLNKGIGIIDSILLKEPNLNNYIFPEPNEINIRETTKNFLKNGRDTFKFGKISFSFFERAWSLRGMENFLMDFLINPDFVNNLFEEIINYNMKIINYTLEYDIDGFYFGDDYGQQDGMIMSPDIWRKFIKPRLSKMFERIKASGKVVALHSCGNITKILDDLINIGLDIYQTVQPEIYDIKHLKKRYGKDLTFWGGISTQHLLPFATPDQLKSCVKKTLNIMSKHGGYIASPTHKVLPDVPAENIFALIEVLKEQ